MPTAPGLCATCVHARVHRNDRASEFWRCARAEKEPEYPKYPRLPVTRCDGYRGDQRKGKC
jgi:hypothetical protein